MEFLLCMKGSVKNARVSPLHKGPLGQEVEEISYGSIDVCHSNPAWPQVCVPAVGSHLKFSLAAAQWWCFFKHNGTMNGVSEQLEMLENSCHIQLQKE